MNDVNESPTTVARLACDEPTARGLAAVLGESLDADDTVCTIFEDADGQWHLALHFREPPDQAAVRSLVGLAAGDDAARALRFERLAGVDWVAQSLAGLPPVRAGRFVIHGAHDRARIPPNALAIEIEAALAFGTGHHGTTRGCLLAFDDLAKRWRHAPIPPLARGRDKKRRGRETNVLDLGTGSGVLAIAVAKRLHLPVIASDIDPRAVEAARGNARLNRAGPLIGFVCAAGTQARAITQHAPYDLIFANILLGPLLKLARPIRQLSAPGGYVVLSGLLPTQANAARALYGAQGLRLERLLVLDGWATLVLRRPKRNRPGRGTGAVTR